MGEPARADTARIPDLSYLALAPETAFSTGYLHSFGHYELMTDNIMDLSHTDYLHPSTLGGAGITTTKPEIVEEEDYIEQKWFASNTKPSALLVSLFPELPAETDLLQGVRWYAPSVMRLVASTVATGRPQEEGYVNLNAHIMTPETAKTTHYFFAATRNYKVDDAELNERLATARKRIFETEDKPMIERVQRVMGDREYWSMKPIIMPIDVAPTMVRRRLQKMIKAEEAERDAAASQSLDMGLSEEVSDI
jgi:vanillate O-demethylase monooxygenase subunit